MPKIGISFGREKRLLSSRQYQAVFDNARFKVGHQYLLLLATPNSLDHPRLGMVIAKKNVRHAVSRNRVKRSAREMFRLDAGRIGSVDIVILARKGIGELDSAQLNRLMCESFSRLGRKVKKEMKKNAPTNSKESCAD